MKLEKFLCEGNMEDPFGIVEELYAVSYPYIKEYLKSQRPNYRALMLLSGRKGNDVKSIRSIRSERTPKDTPKHAHDGFDRIFKDIFGVKYRSNSIFCTGKYDTAITYGDNVYGIFPTGNDYSYCWSPRVNDLFLYVVDGGDPDYRYFGWDIKHVIYEMDYMTYEESGISEEEEEDRLRDEFAENHDISDYKYRKTYNNEEQECIDQHLDISDYKDRKTYNNEEQEYIDQHLDDVLERLRIQQAAEIVDRCEKNVYDLISLQYKDDNLKDALESGNEVMLSGKSYMAIRSDYLPYVIRYMEKYGSKKPTRELFLKAMEGVDLSRYSQSPKDSGNIKRHFKKYINDDLLKMMDELKS